MLTTIERNNKKYQVIEHYSIKINDLYSFVFFISIFACVYFY